MNRHDERGEREGEYDLSDEHQEHDDDRFDEDGRSEQRKNTRNQRQTQALCSLSRALCLLC